MTKKIVFIMQDNTNEEEFINELNTMCSKVEGILQYEIEENDDDEYPGCI